MRVTRPLLASLLALSITVPAWAYEGAYHIPDTPNVHWAYPAVSTMVYDLHWMSLSPLGSFNGERIADRYEMARALHRLGMYLERTKRLNLDEPNADSLHFVDVDPEYTLAVDLVASRWALMEGMPGKSNVRFGGEINLTRYQIAWILNNLITRMEKKGGVVFPRTPSPVEVYTDLPADHWAAPAIHNLTTRHGIIIGYPDSSFRGNEGVSRYELASALYQIWQRLERAEVVPVADTNNQVETATVKRVKVPLPLSNSTVGLNGGGHSGSNVTYGVDYMYETWPWQIGQFRLGWNGGLGYQGLHGVQGAAIYQDGTGQLGFNVRFSPDESLEDPAVHFGLGYRLDVWHGFPFVSDPLYLSHGLNARLGAYVPIIPGIALFGDTDWNIFPFADTRFDRKLQGLQDFFVGVEMYRETDWAFRLGWGAQFYQSLANASTILTPIRDRAGLRLESRWRY